MSLAFENKKVNSYFRLMKNWDNDRSADEINDDIRNDRVNKHFRYASLMNTKKNMIEARKN